MATMIATAHINQRGTLRRFFSKLFSFTKRTPPRLVVWEQTPALNQALQTIRMAANPGEDYEIVAARIETQAAAYVEFLNNPQPIGRISLNVKQFGPAPADTAHVREQYRINEPSEGYADPAEGGASVWYTFHRSNNKVLEFIVHDKDDNELFPIARTYTDWTGTKKFDLGFGRTFYLSVMESAPGYVNVRAGFVEPNEIETAIYNAFEESRTPRPQLVPSAETVSSVQAGRLSIGPRAGSLAILGLFIFYAAMVATLFAAKIPWISLAQTQTGSKGLTENVADFLGVPVSGPQQARVTKMTSPTPSR